MSIDIKTALTEFDLDMLGIKGRSLMNSVPGTLPEMHLFDALRDLMENIPAIMNDAQDIVDDNPIDENEPLDEKHHLLEEINHWLSLTIECYENLNLLDFGEGVYPTRMLEDIAFEGQMISLRALITKAYCEKLHALQEPLTMV